jgi:hypothetical protein
MPFGMPPPFAAGMPWGDMTSPPLIRFNFDNAPPALSF